jgi:hypothetical protein
MRTVRFKTVLDAVSRMAGWGSVMEIDDVRRGKIVEYINVRLREAWEWDWWPELMKIELRAYRPSWDSEYPYMAGNEAYYPADGTYYRCLVGNIGEQPDISDTHWELVSIEDKYIGYEQPGETFIGHVRHVYTRNPRRSQYPGILNFGLSENGVQLSPIAPARVWVEFRIRCNRFCNDEHDPGALYELGDTIYDPTTGECYQALETEAGQYWSKVDFPYIFKNFVVRAVCSDLLRDDGQDEKSYPEESRAYDFLMDVQDVEVLQQSQHDTVAVSTY